MKKSIQFCLILFSFVFLLKNETKGQTAVVTINYGVFTNQCCSANTIAYYCFNDPVTCGAPCGCNTATNSQNFTNPIPAGNIVTQVDISYFALNCGGSVSATINGASVGSSPIINGSCLCSSLGSGATGNSTGNFPCGFAGYNNAAGATETFLSTFSGEVCIATAQITLHYAPASQSVPASQPSAITGLTAVCAGSSQNYSIPAVGNATGYAWTVPAGWSINSGQGTTSINVTAGASGGNVCVDASNLCGTSAQQCLAVSIASTPATPGAPSGVTTMCSGTPEVYTTTGSAGATSYNWTVPAGAVINSGQGTASINVTMGASSGNVCVTASNACGTSAAACTAITIGGVQPTPGSPSGTTSVCNGSSQVYTTTGSGGATSYNWTVPAGTAINSGQGTTSINVTIGSTGGNICVTATGACGTSAAACTPITITSTPATPGIITGSTPVCPGSDNYSIGSVAGATSYNWSVSGGGSVTGGQGTTAATINWTTGGADIVSVSASNACGASTQATFPVTVNPNPIITITPSSTSVCSGSVATMTASGAGGGSYAWSPDPSITSGLNNAAISAIPTISPTTYAVTGTDGNGCKGTATQAITINPTPTVSVAGGGGNSQTVCSGNAVAAINFNITPAGGITWTSTNAAAIGLSPGSGITNPIPGYTAPVVATQQTGVITANATSAAGCTSTSSTDLTYTITINPLPSASTPSYTPASCGVPNGVAMINGTGGSGSYQYSWNSGAFGAGNTYTNAAGTYPVSIQDIVSGCIFTTNVTIPNAGAPPPPAITATTMSVCVGGSVTLFATPPIAGMTYNWTESNSNTGTGSTYTVNNIPASPNPYLVTVTSTSLGCTGTAGTISITVNPLPPTPTFSLPTTANDISCQGSPPTLTVNSGTATAVWYSNNIWLQQGSSYTPPAALPAGTYTFSIIDSVSVPNGCVNAQQSANTVTLSLVVNPSPTAPSTTSNALTTECQNQLPATILNAAPTGTVASVPVWYNGSTYLTTGTSYTPPNGTSGTTVYTVIDSSTVLPNTCTSAAAGSILTLTVTVNPAPSAPIITAPTATSNTSCQGSPPTLTVNSGTTTPVTVAVWYLNNVQVFVGSNYTPPANLAPGTYTYSVIDSLDIPFGCINAQQSANTVTLTLTVNPSPTAPTTTLSSVISECQNQVPPVTLSVTPTGTVTSIPVWYNGTTYVTTGNTYTPPNGTPSNTIYSIIDSSTVLPNTCTSLSMGSVLSLNVIINPSPTQPVFTAPTGPNDTICQAFPTTLSVSSGTVTVIPVWYSGGTFIHAGGNYTPPANLPVGTYTYSIIDSVAAVNGCINALPSANSVTLALYVNPTPSVNVSSAVIDSANCGKAGGVTNLNPSNVSGGTPGYHYQWYDGGVLMPGQTSINLTTLPGAGGTYSLQVTDTNGCVAVTPLGTTSSFTVGSVASPVISFSVSPDSAKGPIPLALTFTNSTIGTGNITYTWTFGDGGSSNLTSPSYTYNTIGTYTVMLVASNGSCKDTSQPLIVITDAPTMIVIPNIFSPNGDNINDMFFIINTGMSTLNCNIFNRWGQLLYTITAPNQGWDGKTPNGDNAPDGTYMYILQAQGLNGKTYKQNGTVTLVR